MNKLVDAMFVKDDLLSYGTDSDSAQGAAPSHGGHDWIYLLAALPLLLSMFTGKIGRILTYQCDETNGMNPAAVGDTPERLRQCSRTTDLAFN